MDGISHVRMVMAQEKMTLIAVRKVRDGECTKTGVDGDSWT